MAVFDSCCFCVPLKTGCFIIGYLQLIGGAIGAALALMTISMGVSLSHSSKAAEVDISGFIIGMGALLLVILIINICFSVVLLVGLHQNKPKNLKAYMIFTVVFLVLYLIVFVVKYVNMKTQKDISDIIVGILNIAVSIYFLLVIRSQHIKMVEEQGQSNAIHIQKV